MSRSARWATELRKIARKYADEIKVVEEGRNWGFYVKKFLASVKIFRPAPWCGAFAYNGAIEAGYPKEKLPPAHLAGRVMEWLNWAKDNKILYKANQFLSGDPMQGVFYGDLFLIINRDGTGHIGIVVAGTSRPAPGCFNTIEGNTNRNGSREGTAVLRRTRRFDDSLWFIRMQENPYWDK